ncbi:GTP-binding protein [Sorangium cellulosum]|uniref:Mutual gliding-motility protein MglA n=1 Tax=Sorangium cellulosum So0157-2 TaxID=1254432 RepID=S4XKE3_SORCE|nr:Rab family GTPase [Sorangium cellulosum]AGP32275.1 Mutual gliding-motility protein MglA [Sorangium cellulosum So0157-2]
MASVNPLSRELVFKIVYYGPGLGGKTTTLEYLHATAKPEYRGKLVSLATPVDRTLYFDFLPVRLPQLRGMNVRLQLFTVPGQVYFNATRKLVLTGADGIVFVSDSQAVRADANVESLENLRENLAEQGRELQHVPLVFQHNKRDLPDLLPLEELDAMLNPFRAASLATSAKTGLGLYEGLEEISATVLRAFESRLPDAMGSGLGGFDAIEGGLVTALRDASPPPSAPLDAVISRLAPPSRPWSTMPPNSTIGDPSEGEGAPGATAPPSAGAAPRSAGVRDPVSRGIPSSLRLAARRLAASAEAPATARADGPSAATRHLAQPGLSFVALWPTAEREAVAEIEAAIAAERYAVALQRCGALVAGIVAKAAELAGATDAPRDPAAVPALLGLDGRRYLGFRAAVRRAQTGGEVTERDALKAFAFVIEARLAESAI